MEELQDSEKIEKSLICFRKLIEEDKSLFDKIPQDFFKDDKFLARFIRVKKFDCEKAHVMLKNYIALRKKNKKHFRTLVPSNHKNMMDRKMHIVLKNRDLLGRKIFFFRTSLWDPSVTSLDEIMIGMILCLEEMAESEETQQHGVVFVADQEGLGFKHFTQFRISQILAILSVLQGKFPLRCQGLHNVNDPNWLQKLGSFAKPFFSIKLQKRVHFHGNNLASLHKFIPREILPQSLGGTLGSWEEATDHKLFERMNSRESHYRKWAQLSD